MAPANRPAVRSNLGRACLGAGGVLAALLLLTSAGVQLIHGAAEPTPPEKAQAATGIVGPAVQANSQAGAPLPAANQTGPQASLPDAPGEIEPGPAPSPTTAADGATTDAPGAPGAPGAAISPEAPDSAAASAPTTETASVPGNAAAASPAAPVSHAVISEPPPNIDAPAYVVMDRACGAVVWGKNETERLPPASLTKIVTALAVVDMLSLDEMAESHVSGAKMKERGSSVMGVEPGMELSVLDLLNGLMLKSGNDAALVLAEHAGFGNVEAFMAAMNAKAQAVGMTNSQFANPHGLDQAGHYSSALDMAKAGAALLDDPVLAEISATPEYWPDWDGSSIRNGNKLLQRYPGAYGVKIGYTEDAGQTIVAAAERNGRHVIVSLFGSVDRYMDAAQLLDWAFTKTTPACT